MNSFYQEITSDIKYFAFIDRYNNPLLFFNTSSKEKELDYQIHIISSLEILDYKLSNETTTQNQQKMTKDEYLGLLLPLYEYEYDLGSYGYIGKNDIKIIVIKKLENKEDPYLDKKVQNLSQEIHGKYKKLLLNPFYDQESFIKENSTLKETFIKDIFNCVK